MQIVDILYTVAQSLRANATKRLRPRYIHSEAAVYIGV